jgi:hypothetical protein
MCFVDLVGPCAFTAHGDDEPGDSKPSDYGNDEEHHRHRTAAGWALSPILLTVSISHPSHEPVRIRIDGHCVTVRVAPLSKEAASHAVSRRHDRSCFHLKIARSASAWCLASIGVPAMAIDLSSETTRLI